MIRRGVLAGVFGLGLAGCGAGAGLDRLASGERGRVAKVRSGETIVLDSGLVVRLAGVEAPNGPEPWAVEAEQALSRLLEGQDVTLLYGGARRDRYDRAIAHVRRNKGHVWAQQALLEAGCARVHTWPDNRALAGAMLRTEAEARGKARGLWALPDYRVLLPSEAVHRRGFLIVEGRVRDVHTEGREARLSFAEGGLEAGVRRDALPATGTLAGRVVRLRGWAGWDGLKVDHAEAVEFISAS